MIPYEIRFRCILFLIVLPSLLFLDTKTGTAQNIPFTITEPGISINALPESSVPHDTLKIRFFRYQRFIPTHDSSFSITCLLLPSAAKSDTRVSLVSDFTDNFRQYEINKGVQRYYDQNCQTAELIGLFDLADSVQTGVNIAHPAYIEPYIINAISALNEKEMVYSVWRSKTVHVKDETHLDDIIRDATREIYNHGYTDLGTDLLPFISVLMQEQHFFHYNKNRMIMFSQQSKGVVTVIEMLSALESMDENQRAGVCRDSHESGMRIARSMVDEYLKQKYPGNNYDIDDYIFLQAWVTPKSHHITIVVTDPQNPRNYYELDWGRVYKKEDIEGPVIGNNIGTTIRLWRFDKSSNKTVSFDLIKTQWGLLFDKEILPKKEFTSINGIYSPIYANYGNYIKNYGNKVHLTLSQGMLNAGQSFFLISLSRTSRQMHVTPLFIYKGITGLQTMILEDSQRKNYTLPWAEWHSALNWLNVIRYFPAIQTRDINLGKNISANAFINGQIDIFLATEHYEVTNGGDLEGSHHSGDGNVWFSYGTEFLFVNNSRSIESGIRVMQRNFLMPSDVRYLSPNPSATLGHAAIVNNACDAEIYLLLGNSNHTTRAEFAFERNKLHAQFIRLAIQQTIALGERYMLAAKAAHFRQIQGIEYYWYPKTSSLFELGLMNQLKNGYIGVSYMQIQSNDHSYGIRFQKFF